MEKRALAAEERATEAVVMERKARAALEAREKQMANMPGSWSVGRLVRERAERR